MRLSILIPVYNEEVRLPRALESALAQRTTFPFEVIVVDDGSTDGTAKVAERYCGDFPNLTVLRNQQNKGKGASVIRAYAAARGEYVHILDADDYFTSQDKVQRQVEELDAHPHLFAVAHNTLLRHPDGTMEVMSALLAPRDYTYEECVGFTFYHHTSSYMVRRLEGGLPQAFAARPGLRGDSAFMYFHAFRTKKGVRYLPDVHSVYDHHGGGLWSSLDAEGQRALNLDLFAALQEEVVYDPTSSEHAILQKKIDALAAGGQPPANPPAEGDPD